MGFWGTAACTCLRSQWNNSLINIHQTQRLFVFILSTRESWLDQRGRIIHFMPFSSLVLFSWLFSLTLNDPWLEKAKMKLPRGNRHPPPTSDPDLQPAKKNYSYYVIISSLGNKSLWSRMKRDKRRGVNRRLNGTVFCCEIVRFSVSGQKGNQ